MIVGKPRQPRVPTRLLSFRLLSGGTSCVDPPPLDLAPGHLSRDGRRVPPGHPGLPIVVAGEVWVILSKAGIAQGVKAD